LEKVKKDKKTGTDELNALVKTLSALEAGIPARLVDFSNEESRALQALQLLSMKKVKIGKSSLTLSTLFLAYKYGCRRLFMPLMS
jgi:hypothetical protein